MDWLKIFRTEDVEEVKRPKHDPNFKPEEEHVVLEIKPESPHFDEHSANWQFVKSEIERSLENWRKKNDKPSSIEDTAFNRGRIQQLKDLLNLPERLRADRKAPH